MQLSNISLNNCYAFQRCNTNTNRNIYSSTPFRRSYNCRHSIKVYNTFKNWKYFSYLSLSRILEGLTIAITFIFQLRIKCVMQMSHSSITTLYAQIHNFKNTNIANQIHTKVHILIHFKLTLYPQRHVKKNVNLFVHYWTLIVQLT